MPLIPQHVNWTAIPKSKKNPFRALQPSVKWIYLWNKRNNSPGLKLMSKNKTCSISSPKRQTDTARCAAKLRPRLHDFVDLSQCAWQHPQQISTGMILIHWGSHWEIRKTSCDWDVIGKTPVFYVIGIESTSILWHNFSSGVVNKRVVCMQRYDSNMTNLWIQLRNHWLHIYYVILY